MNLNNRVQLIGTLGSNPVIKEFESGSKVARFSVFTVDVVKKDDEFLKETLWHTVVAWDKLADQAVKHLIKGGEVVVDGKLARRSYIDTTGQNQFITEVIAYTIIAGAQPQNIEMRNIKRA